MLYFSSPTKRESFEYKNVIKIQFLRQVMFIKNINNIKQIFGLVWKKNNNLRNKEVYVNGWQDQYNTKTVITQQ